MEVFMKVVSQILSKWLVLSLVLSLGISGTSFGMLPRLTRVLPTQIMPRATRALVPMRSITKSAVLSSSSVIKKNQPVALRLHFIDAVEVGDLGRVEELINQNVSLQRALVNDRCYGSHTPLTIIACMPGDEKKVLDMVQLLVGAGANVNVATGDGFTPLMCAAAAGHTSTVDFLIKSGADVHARNIIGDTALTYAKQRGLWEIVELLVNCEAYDNGVKS
jgi:ankyrin repeat protein